MDRHCQLDALIGGLRLSPLRQLRVFARLGLAWHLRDATLMVRWRHPDDADARSTGPAGCPRSTGTSAEANSVASNCRVGIKLQRLRRVFRLLRSAPARPKDDAAPARPPARARGDQRGRRGAAALAQPVRCRPLNPVTDVAGCWPRSTSTVVAYALPVVPTRRSSATRTAHPASSRPTTPSQRRVAKTAGSTIPTARPRRRPATIRTDAASNPRQAMAPAARACVSSTPVRPDCAGPNCAVSGHWRPVLLPARHDPRLRRVRPGPASPQLRRSRNLCVRRAEPPADPASDG